MKTKEILAFARQQIQQEGDIFKTFSFPNSKIAEVLGITEDVLREKHLEIIKELASNSYLVKFRQDKENWIIRCCPYLSYCCFDLEKGIFTINFNEKLADFIPPLKER